jgi:hypothetical protein
MQQPEDMLESVALGDIVEFGERVPLGRYPCRLIACDGKLSKKNKPMVQATFEVVSGEHQGAEIPIFYTMYRGKDKRGRTMAPGIMEMVKALHEIGMPLGDDFRFPADEHGFHAQKMAALYGRAFKEKVVDILILPDVRDEKDDAGSPTGKKIEGTRAKVAKSEHAPVAAKSDPWAGV